MNHDESNLMFECSSCAAWPRFDFLMGSYSIMIWSLVTLGLAKNFGIAAQRNFSLNSREKKHHRVYIHVIRHESQAVPKPYSTSISYRRGTSWIHHLNCNWQMPMECQPLHTSGGWNRWNIVRPGSITQGTNIIWFWFLWSWMCATRKQRTSLQASK